MPATTANNNNNNIKSDIQAKKVIACKVPSESESKKVVEIVNSLSNATDSDREAIAADLAAAVKSNGILSLKPVLVAFDKDIVSKKNVNARASAIAGLVALINENLEGQTHPFLIRFVSTLLELQADKQASIKEAAAAAARNLIEKINPNACTLMIPFILEGLANSCKWQTKMLSLELLQLLAKTHPKEFFVGIPDVVPVVSDCMWDTKSEVKKKATETMSVICGLIENKDIERFIPAVIACINHPENVPETIHLLGATTFVQEVDSATLSIMVPLLSRGLNERATPIKRKSALIIDNMSKLVDDPDVAAPFLPVLLPALEKVQDVVADPECRGVVQKALATLQRVANPGVEVFTKEQKKAKVESAIKGLLPENLDSFFDTTVSFLNDVALTLCVSKNFFKDIWIKSLAPYASSFLSRSDAEGLAVSALDNCEDAVTPKDPEEEDDEDSA
ncbi:hypothetical protein G6F70_004669 [Rhizopus microsporus]|nr:hypothetical protein G6F71_004056 [Rhizopus microsporus]KAG1199708.1 hypothetical protein G6F70_004669 [Rhizopus microsporus]KAG1211440.1 hypothetical protein G6F69_004578 [Rhizopus microsporus]KAG1233362.1 hypothetical protein G6F67_004316 [Rhizopus microsporus]KAG1266256.1 hypothetical protein G6F68_002921 [Rhizopus microsporus]